MQTVYVQYSRKDAGFDGAVYLVEDKALPRSLLSFEGFTFSRMMSRFAACAISHPTAELCMLREENGGLRIPLSTEVAVQLRADPAAAIASMSVPDRTLARVATSPIRAGSEVLADAFGHEVYCTLRYEGDGVFSVECPFSGRWVGLGATQAGQILAKTGRQSVSGDWLPVRLEPLVPGALPKWAVVASAVLVTHKLNGESPPRFFTPRRWNEGRPWISREDFAGRLKAFTDTTR